MKVLLLGLAFACVAAAPASSFADTFDYTFTSGSSNDNFTYDSPTLITTAISFVPSSCNACTGAFIDPGPAGIVRILFGLNSDEYDGLPASFYALGDNTAFGGFLTLNIVDVPSVMATPEPSSLLLLGTGVMGLIGILRRKRMKYYQAPEAIETTGET